LLPLFPMETKSATDDVDASAAPMHPQNEPTY
jgi:hypothetical protein